MRNEQPNSNDDQGYEKVGEFVCIFKRRCVWYVNYQHEGRQVRRSLKTKSKKEARRRALPIEKEILAGEHKHQRRIPLIKEVIDQYLDHLRAEGSTDGQFCTLEIRKFSDGGQFYLKNLIQRLRQHDQP